MELYRPDNAILGHMVLGTARLGYAFYLSKEGLEGQRSEGDIFAAWVVVDLTARSAQCVLWAFRAGAPRLEASTRTITFSVDRPDATLEAQKVLVELLGQVTDKA
ncbi:MAG: hypothetical protein WCK39_00945 [Methanomassiliicoccales archaeon]